jgi:hypothetical protein
MLHERLALGLLAMAQGTGTFPCVQESPIRLRVVGPAPDETPISDEIGPLFTTDFGSRGVVMSPLQHLVHTANSAVKRVAFLPVNVEHDQIVEQLVRAHAPAATSKRIRIRR